MQQFLPTRFFLATLFFFAATTAGSPFQWVPLGEPGSGGTIVALSVFPHDSQRLLIAGDMLGVGRSSDRGKSWQACTGFSCFEDGSFTWHPTDAGTVWLGTMAGPYVSHDGGQTWAEKRVGFPPMEPVGYRTPVEKILFDPRDNSHKRLLAIGGSSRHWDCGPHPLYGVIWESTDAGEHWMRLTTVTAQGSDDAPNAKGVNLWLAEYAAGQPDVIYGVADDAGLVVSEDGGRSWKVRRGVGLPDGVTVRRVAFSPVDPKTMWGCISDRRQIQPGSNQASRVPGGVFKSTDGGLTWVDSSAGFKLVNGNQENQVSRFEGLSVSPVDPNVLYVSDTAWNAGIIYKSDNAGGDWHAVASKQNLGQTGQPETAAFVPRTAYFAGLAMTGSVCDPRDAGTAYFFNTEFILGTHDGGRSFDDFTSEKTGDGGWRGRGYSGLCTEHFGFNPYRAGQSIAMAMDAARCWLSDDHLKTWRYPLTDPGPWFGGFDCGFSKDGHIFTTSGQYGFYGIGRSSDGGKTWQVLQGKKQGLPEARMGGGRGSEGIYVNPENAAHVWAVVEGHLYRSTDGGDNWTVLRTPSTPHFIAGDPSNPDRLWVSSDRNLYLLDDGEHVTFKGGPRPGGRLHFDSQGRLYVCSYEGSRGGLWRYTPTVDRWERLRDDAQIMDMAIDAKNPDRLAVATNMMPYTSVQRATGVWISGDAGRTWEQQNSGLPMTRGGAIAFDPFDSRTLIFGSFGRGFFRAQWSTDYKPTAGVSYVTSEVDRKFAAVDATEGKPRPVKLRNGDMTQGDGLPTAWDGKWGDVTVSRDTEIYKSAPASLSVTTVGNRSTGQASQTFDVTGGQTVRVSGNVKSTGDVKVNFAVQSYDQNWHPVAFEQVKYVQNETDWTPATKDVVLPTDAAHAGVLLLVEGAGKAWLDDAAVSTVP